MASSRTLTETIWSSTQASKLLPLSLGRRNFHFRLQIEIESMSAALEMSSMPTWKLCFPNSAKYSSRDSKWFPILSNQMDNASVINTYVCFPNMLHYPHPRPPRKLWCVSHPLRWAATVPSFHLPTADHWCQAVFLIWSVGPWQCQYQSWWHQVAMMQCDFPLSGNGKDAFRVRISSTGYQEQNVQDIDFFPYKVWFVHGTSDQRKL